MQQPDELTTTSTVLLARAALHGRAPDRRTNGRHDASDNDSLYRAYFENTSEGLFIIDVEARRLRGVNGYLLPPGEFQPAFHVQRQFAVRPIVDDLSHSKGMPARFGGSDDTVGW